MKTLIYKLLFTAVPLIFVAMRVNAQINIAQQPLWGPTGYPQVNYYYLPDIECYYNVPSRQFIYLSGGRWVFSATLPAQYRSYDLYAGYKVVIDRARPYLNFNEDRLQYQKFVNWTGDKQEVIRDSKDPRYKRQPAQPTKGKSAETKGDFGP